jgi:hypothetical protein
MTERVLTSFQGPVGARDFYRRKCAARPRISEKSALNGVSDGFQPGLGIGTTVGQDISAALAGSTTVADALEKSQASTISVMTKAGYIK